MFGPYRRSPSGKRRLRTKPREDVSSSLYLPLWSRYAISRLTPHEQGPRRCAMYYKAASVSVICKRTCSSESVQDQRRIANRLLRRRLYRPLEAGGDIAAAARGHGAFATLL